MRDSLCQLAHKRVTFFLEGWLSEGYNIFVMTNISTIEAISNLFQAIGQDARLQILLAIGEDETCVCHLEATFGWRQAYLSQHLMALRETGLVLARRDGRYMHYRLVRPGLLQLIQQAAIVQGVELPHLAPSCECHCPNCKCERERENEENPASDH